MISADWIDFMHSSVMLKYLLLHHYFSGIKILIFKQNN